MKFFKTSTLFLASALLLSACGGGGDKKDGKEEGKKDAKDKKEKKEKKVSIYNYKNADTQVSITTYKHTAKNGVGIDFDTLNVSGVGSDSKSITDLFDGAKFTIPISGLNSGNADRDKKIREHFFGTMKKTKAIKGSIEKMKLDGKKGKATLAIKMNGKSQNVKMDLERKKKKLMMSGEIDATNWGEGAKKGLDALEKACEAKHTGEDGKTKLWSTVTLNISTKLDLKERMAS